MFASRISVLSLFILCLFTLGQAAPVLDNVPSLLTRDEAPSDLVTRAIFKKWFHSGKTGPATQKNTDHEIAGHCKTLLSLLDSKKGNVNKKRDLIMTRWKGHKSSVDAKALEKDIEDLATLIKKLESEIKNEEESLKKLGITDGRTHCSKASTMAI